MISKSTTIAGLTRYFCLNNRTTLSYYNEQTKIIFFMQRKNGIFKKGAEWWQWRGETVEGHKCFAVRGLLTYVCCFSPRMLSNTAYRLALEQAHAALSALFTPCNPCHFVIPLLSNTPAPRTPWQRPNFSFQPASSSQFQNSGCCFHHSTHPLLPRPRTQVSWYTACLQVARLFNPQHHI